MAIFARPTSRRRVLASGLVLLAGAAGAVGLALGSDHQDTPDVELNQASDMTDLYVFPGSSPDRIVLVMNTWAFLTPAETPTSYFDPNLLYQFKIDNTGDAVEDKVIQVTFTGSGSSQQAQVRGPVAPPRPGAMDNEIADATPAISGRVNSVTGNAPGMQLFAGHRDDPFFIDLEQFFRILPDRKPVTGPLAALPETPTATAWRGPGEAVNYISGFNVLSIVIELPVSDLTAGGNSRLGIWGIISR
ncbi:MAG TPA: DUF4331 family protein [Gemmatimonadales bacterium]|jgi:hypothetical protein|nr:DUF4331 family protein [Gemmatimonadales bacterium]